jgi:hypothetical protein
MIEPSSAPLNPWKYRVTLGDACSGRSGLAWALGGALALYILPPFLSGVVNGIGDAAREEMRRGKRRRK